jgi:hypothetical protein
VSLGMERLPEGSVSVPVTLHDPGVNDESVHDVAEPIS